MVSAEVSLCGKEKRLSLGVYPVTSLKDARARCDETRKLLSDGVDPSQQRKVDMLVRAERSEDTFEKIGREWYAKQSEVWIPEHAAEICLSLVGLYPACGRRPQLLHSGLLDDLGAGWEGTDELQRCKGSRPW